MLNNQKELDSSFRYIPIFLIGLVISFVMYSFLMKRKGSLDNYTPNQSALKFNPSSNNFLNQNTTPQNIVIPLENKVKTGAFFKAASEVVHDYYAGDKLFIKGWRSSKISENGFGDVIELKLNDDIFTAREYFEKDMLKAQQMVGVDENTVHMKELLVQAINLRIEGIGLVIKGEYLKQERGQVRNANFMGQISEARADVILTQQEKTLPSYNGEIEEGMAKIKVADSYLMDALNLLGSNVQAQRLVFGDSN